MDTLFNVLSLEDSDLDFEIIKEQLIKAGYNLNISRAETENEFRSLISNHKFDIILADYNLPRFDGFEALKICNLHCPEVPFICVSGSVGEIMAIELLKMGAVDYVIKDRLERLPFAVKRALAEAKEKKALQLAEEELRRNEEKFRTLTENIPDIIARFDKDMNHIYVNPAIVKVTGISPDAFIGKTNKQLAIMPEDKVAIWDKHLQLVFQTAKQSIFEFDFQTPEGTTIYFLSMIVPEVGENGKVKTILSVTRDISVQKRAEIALKKSEERLRDVIFSSSDWIWETDENIRYTYSSQRDIELFNVAPDEIIGKTPFDFMPAAEAKRVEAIFSEIKANKEPIKDLENWNIGKDGNMICLLTNGLPILDNEGKLIGYRGVNKDITEWKNAEQELINAKEKAEASNRLKTAFMNNISHEIRTPLNGILGFGQILTDPAFSDMEKVRYFGMLNESCDRLLNAVTNIMDISLLTSGNQKIIKEEVELCELINHIGEKFQQSCHQKNIIISWPENPKNNKYRILTDQTLISKIFYQLIDNAVKFTSHGTISIDCEEHKNELQFSVKDSGIGISEEYKNRIFGNFEQEDFAITRKFEGTGIGLSIVKKSVELLGGKIWMNSEKGKGSSFYFSIPVSN